MSPRDDERDDGGERPRRSWREIDRMRDGARERGERGPRSPAAEARARSAAQQYLKQIDGLFSAGTGGGEGARLSQAVRDAHGTPGLADACRAYIAALGPPRDPAVASLVLDAGETNLARLALEGLAAAAGAGELRLSGGLRTQLQLLAEDPDDDIAYAAEELLK